MLRDILSDQFKLLGFRQPSRGIAVHWKPYLAYGFIVTFLAGVGRYWDNPKAQLWQNLGLGSIAYVVVLASLLWLIYLPLRPERWQFRNVLLFVTFCSAPALLYAIPVERFMSLPAAQAANAWFLGIVASWRVALLMVFLHRVARLEPLIVLIASLLPLTLIVTVLSILNLEHVVFNLMAGIRAEDASPNDVAYLIVLRITMFSVMAFPALLVAYGLLVFRAWRKKLGPDQPR
ncbi:hypothetical protein [Arenimonas sp.]|uniref:hypothetical protein n=1 Tax=Arenimonas sp. TaxID=1872635 RepID=UPI0039E6411C